MSHTNETVNFHLPQFTADDKPDWLVDVNDAFQAIDTGMEATQSEAESASSVAQLAQTTAENAATTAGQASSDVAGLDADVETLQGTVNSITSLIGNGQPTTTDKTIIGAINELHADITENELGTAVDLADYTSSNKFVCPSDGYVMVFVTGSGTSIAHLGSNMIACTNDGDVAIPTFVRKGQQVYATLTGGGKCSFYAFQ